MNKSSVSSIKEDEEPPVLEGILSSIAEIKQNKKLSHQRIDLECLSIVIYVITSRVSGNFEKGDSHKLVQALNGLLDPELQLRSSTRNRIMEIIFRFSMVVNKENCEAAGYTDLTIDPPSDAANDDLNLTKTQSGR